MVTKKRMGLLWSVDIQESMVAPRPTAMMDDNLVLFAMKNTVMAGECSACFAVQKTEIAR